MSITETKAQIAQGVRRHIRQVNLMGGDVSPLGVMQVAFQILDAFHPGASGNSGAENREFVVECGFSAQDAKRVISDDDQPNAIY